MKISNQRELIYLYLYYWGREHFSSWDRISAKGARKKTGIFRQLTKYSGRKITVSFKKVFKDVLKHYFIQFFYIALHLKIKIVPYDSVFVLKSFCVHKEFINDSVFV